MKRVLLYLIAFILPIFLLVIIYPVNRRYRYQYLEHDCFNHALWIYDRIYNNPTPVDIAFFGSSHTINGINEGEIEINLTDSNTHIANFGYCRLGTDLYYVLLKDLLRKKDPHLVILEVRGDEDWFSHPVFPYLAENSDVYLPKLLVNRKLFHDYYIAFTFKLQLIQDLIFSRTQEAPLRKNTYGFAATPDTASINILSKAKMRRLKPHKEMTRLERNFEMKYPRSYLKEFARLCQENNIQLCFLYLPHYAARYKQPLELLTYQKYGKILYPPDSLMHDTNNWGDDEHLNRTGALKMSEWLADALDQCIMK